MALSYCAGGPEESPNPRKSASVLSHIREFSGILPQDDLEEAARPPKLICEARTGVCRIAGTATSIRALEKGERHGLEQVH